MSSQSPKESAHSPARGPGASAPATRHADHEGLLGDDVIHVPKGKSRLYYAGMIGLLIFLTVIFLVPGAMLQTFLGPGRDDPEVFAYTRLDGSRRVLHASEFQQERRVYEDVFALLEILPMMMGISERNPSDQTLARLMVLDDVAHASGIRITDAELATFLSSLQVDAPTWRAATARYGGPGRVEPKLKRVLAVRRYVDLVGQIARVPDVQAIEERWTKEHVEVAFDFASIRVEDLLDAARADAPDDAGLEAWLAGRPEFERTPYMRPATFRATFARFLTPEETPAEALLAAYPGAEGEDPETLAENYYNQVFFARFQRPEEETAAQDAEGEGEAASEGETGEGDAETSEEPETPDEPKSPYLSLDEVRDVARAEAPVYFAMQRWVADLQQRAAAGETLDLAVEAESMGLSVLRIDEPETLVALGQRADLGTFAVGPVGATPPGQISPRVVADKGGLFAVQVDEKLDPAMPAFAEIRDKVLEAWTRERAAELAIERLEAVRAGFDALAAEDDADEGEEAEDAPETPERRTATEEAFAAAAEQAGLALDRRDWLDKSAPANSGPRAAEPGHQFLSQHREYAELEVGEVPAPALDRTREAAYLVRLAGKRPIDLAQMTPSVYQSYKTGSAVEAANAVRAYFFSQGLDDAYGITWMFEREPAEDPDAADAAGDPAADAAQAPPDDEE